MTNLVTESMHDEGDDVASGSSSSDEEEDPRIAAMFGTANQDEDALPSATRPIHVSENAILECFQRAIESHNQPNPGARGIWKAPSLLLLQEDDAKDDSAAAPRLADWKPASLPLPAWAVQPPAKEGS